MMKSLGSFLIFLYFFSMSSLQASHPETLKLKLRGPHGIQFAGFYMAQEKGFYAKENLQVEFIPRKDGELQHKYIQDVVQGTYNYGISDSALLLERLNGMPVTLLAQIYQNSPISVFTLKGHALQTSDLRSEDILSKGNLIKRPNKALVASFFKSRHLLYDAKPEDLIKGKVDAIMGYASILPYTFKAENVPVSILELNTRGIRLYGDNLFTCETELKEHPERVNKFIRASLKGWKYALDNQIETVDLVYRKYNPEKKSRDNIDWEANTLPDYIQPEKVQLGAYDKVKWENIARNYRHTGLTDSSVIPEDFFYHQTTGSSLFTPEERDWIEKNPTLKVATDPAWDPIEYRDEEGVYHGIAIDFLEEVSKITGFQIEFIQENWQELIRLAKQGKIDIFSAITDTPERAKFLNFTSPFLNIPVGIFAKQDIAYIGHIRDLNGKKAAVVASYSYSELISSQFPEIQLVPVKTNLDGIKRLVKGEVDVFIGNMLTTSNLLATNGYLTIRIVGETPFTNPLGIGSKKDSPILQSIMQKALDHIPEQRKKDIYREWTTLLATPAKEIDYTLLWQVIAVAVIILLAFLYRNRNLSSIVNKRTEALQEANRELVQEKKFINTITRVLPGIFMVYEEGKGIIKINREIEKQTGYQFEYILDQPVSNWLKCDKKTLDEVYETSLKFGSDTREMDLLDKNNNPITYLVSTALLKDGQKNFLVSIGINLNELKQAEAKLKITQQSVDKSTDAVFWTDDSGQITYVNQTAVTLSGLEAKELLQMDIYHLFVDELPQFKDDWQRFAEKESLLISSSLIKNSGDLLPVDISLNFQEMEDSRYVFIYARDITERQLSEEKLKQSQKMEAIGTLAGGIAHDFNNILSAIIGYAQMAEYDLPDGHEVKEDVKEVYKAGVRAKKLVEQILTFSRQGPSEIGPIKIQFILKEALKMLRASIPSTIRFDLNINEAIGAVIADTTQVHQVIVNLCSNAAYAMKEKGGVLTVDLNQIEIKEKLSQGDLHLEPGLYAKLVVKDTGTGMNEETRKRIFEPYFSTKRPGEGTGLGLAVVHGIIAGIHGQIIVKSQINQGTEFNIFLPIVRIDSPVLPDIAEENFLHGTERIMIVDDERSVINMESKMLASLGYQVSVFEHPADAWEQFDKTPDAFDLIITDMTMPDMTGLELSRKILQAKPEMPIIICTGYSEKINDEIAEQNGIRKLLMKPVLKGTFSKEIRKVLEQ